MNIYWVSTYESYHELQKEKQRFGWRLVICDILLTFILAAQMLFPSSYKLYSETRRLPAKWHNKDIVVINHILFLFLFFSNYMLSKSYTILKVVLNSHEAKCIVQWWSACLACVMYKVLNPLPRSPSLTHPQSLNELIQF